MRASTDESIGQVAEQMQRFRSTRYFFFSALYAQFGSSRRLLIGGDTGPVVLRWGKLRTLDETQSGSFRRIDTRAGCLRTQRPPFVTGTKTHAS